MLYSYCSSSYKNGTVLRLAGSGAEENRNTTYPSRAGFAQPSGICVGVHQGDRAVYIADAESSSVRMFSLTNGAVKAVVGGARDPLVSISTISLIYFFMNV